MRIKGAATYRLRMALLVAATATAAHAEVVIQGGQFLSGDMAIPASAGQAAGSNLFHSFTVFNVQRGESVTFTPTGFPGPKIDNVISRVTGGTSEITGLKSSLIDGPVVVDIPGANFYFINPRGVVFGEFGSVQADGSVHISTADNLKLKDGGVFHADPTKTSTLTAAAPSAFGFLNARPAGIAMDGPYVFAPVPPGKTFALVGGDIEIRPATFPTEIVAPGSKVHLASVRSAGNAVLRDDGTVDLGGFAELGRVSLGAPTIIDVSEDGPGSIDIRAGELTLSGAELYAQNYGIGEPGRIDIDVRGPIQIRDTSFLDVGGGAAGTISVRGGEMTVSGSYLLAQTFGDAAGGVVDIAVGGNLTLETNPDTGFISAIDVVSANLDTTLAGPAIRLDAKGTLAVSGGSLVVAGTGSLAVAADRVQLTGTGVETAVFSAEIQEGMAGSLNVDARTVELRDGAQISSSTGGTGDAGSVVVNAAESIRISGESSGIFSTVGAGASGRGGSVRVTTQLLAIDEGLIDASTFGDGDAGSVGVKVGELQLVNGGQIRSFSGGYDVANNNQLVVGKGAAGSVSIDATGSVTISGTTASGFPSGLLAETRGEGAGGNVTLTAHYLTLSDGATISSSSVGTGLAGDVRITLGDTLTMRNASIATQALTSDGGNIVITVPRLIDMVDSRITTSVQSGVGGGGNIAIDPDFLVLQRSQIIANAFGGPGGNIDIVAGQLIADPYSVIEASSALGIDGNVTIDAPNPDVGSNLVVLPESFLDVAGLLQPTCGAARSGLSSLVQVGRGGLPADPDGYLPSSTGIAVPAAPSPGAALGGLPGDGVRLADLSCTQ